MKLGYTILYVEDVEATMNFYSDAFGLKKGFLHPEKDYGEMITGETKLAFASQKLADSHGFAYEKQSKDSSTKSFELALVSDSVEESYHNAISKGATPIKQPAKKPWGQVVCYVRDNNGFLIEICSPVGESD